MFFSNLSSIQIQPRSQLDVDEAEVKHQPNSQVGAASYSELPLATNSYIYSCNTLQLVAASCSKLQIQLQVARVRFTYLQLATASYS